MICPSCQQDVHPVHHMQASGGFIQRCPRAECNAIVNPTAPPSAPAAPRQAPTPPPKPRAKRVAKPKLDAMAALRARRAKLRAKLAEADAMRVELAMLDAAIAAADAVGEAHPARDAKRPQPAVSH